MAKSNLTTPYNVQLQCTHCAAPVIGVHPSAVHLHRDGVQRLWITDGIGSLFTVAHAPSTKPNLAHMTLMVWGTEAHPQAQKKKQTTTFFCRKIAKPAKRSFEITSSSEPGFFASCHSVRFSASWPTSRSDTGCVQSPGHRSCHPTSPTG